jgi:hypothetical protein
MSAPLRIFAKHVGGDNSPLCTACSLWNWPQLCKLVNGGAKPCVHNGESYYWSAWAPIDTPPGAILTISDLFNKSADQVKSIVAAKIDAAGRV